MKENNLNTIADQYIVNMDTFIVREETSESSEPTRTLKTEYICLTVEQSSNFRFPLIERITKTVKTQKQNSG